jgi:flagellar biosynthesis protein FlhG
MREKVEGAPRRAGDPAAPPAASPLELVVERFIATTSAVGRRGCVRARQAVTTRLVVGQTRLQVRSRARPRDDRDQRAVPRHPFDYLGHIEHDDAVWLSVRRKSPLLIDSPDVEERAQHRAHRAPHPGAADGRGRARESRPRPSPAGHAGRAREWRRPPEERCTRCSGSRAPRRTTRSGARTNASARSSARAASRWSRSWRGRAAATSRRASRRPTTRCSIPWCKRRAYDLSTFPDDGSLRREPRAPSTSARAAELVMLQAELAREINAETEFTG